MKIVLGTIAALLANGGLHVLGAAPLRLETDPDNGTLRVFREGAETPLLTQNARADFRPYIHPIQAPDGKGVLTEYSPGHHRHQMGLFWGFTQVNGRDYFHHPEGTHWRRERLEALESEGEKVSWKTVYDLLGADGEAVLVETQTWSVQDHGDRYEMDLLWEGQAQTDVTIGRHDYGGLFLRMPWRPGMPAEVVNAARERDAKAEGRRALWLDLAMQVEGRSDLAHIAFFDHPENAGFPLPWRVDGQFESARSGPGSVIGGSRKARRKPSGIVWWFTPASSTTFP